MMPWGLFSLALVLVLVLQTSVLPFCVPPAVDLLLALALVCGLTAPAVDARLAACLVGFAQDLDTAGPFGLHALLLGLAVTALTHLREWVNRHLWWARWLVGFVAALPAQFVLELHLRYGHGEWGRMLLDAALTSLVAALLAALVTALPTLLRRRGRLRFAPRW